jgi:hypothetical protein
MAVVVVRHVLDETAGVYRLVVAHAVVEETIAPPDDAAMAAHLEAVRAAEDAGEDPPAPPEPETLAETVFVHPAEFVFAADDPRWAGEDGERLPLETVAAVQRREVRDALEAREQASEPVEHPELPGVGDPL